MVKIFHNTVGIAYLVFYMYLPYHRMKTCPTVIGIHRQMYLITYATPIYHVHPAKAQVPVKIRAKLNIGKSHSLCLCYIQPVCTSRIFATQQCTGYMRLCITQTQSVLSSSQGNNPGVLSLQIFLALWTSSEILYTQCPILSESLNTG